MSGGACDKALVYRYGIVYDADGQPITDGRIRKAGGSPYVPFSHVEMRPGAVIPPVRRFAPERVCGNLYRCESELFGGMDVRVDDSPVDNSFEYYVVEGSDTALLRARDFTEFALMSFIGPDGTTLFTALDTSLDDMGFEAATDGERNAAEELGPFSVLIGSPDESAEDPEYRVVTAAELESMSMHLAWMKSAFASPVEEEQAPPVEVLSPVKVSQPITIHSLAMKAFDSMLDSLFKSGGEVVVRPRRGNSMEEYRLSVVPAKVSAYCAAGGNPEYIKCILETVHTLMSDGRAAAYESDGRVWFTVNTIVEEIRRTSYGTVEGRKCPNDAEVTDAGLLALSSMQMTGYSPSGDPTNVMYMFNAERMARITYKGRTYENVWGFSKDAYTIGSYAAERGQQYAYPLLESDTPMTRGEAEARRYLLDVLNQIRGKLYRVGRGGKVTRSKIAEFTVTRSWASIFESIRPLDDLRPEQKQKIVNDFQEMLRKLADMDSKGGLRKGMPLYIEAHSTRLGNRGGGSGAWDQLVVTGHSYLDASLTVDIGGKERKKRARARKKA